jgi:hypothetical protein
MDGVRGYSPGRIPIATESDVTPDTSYTKAQKASPKPFHEQCLTAQRKSARKAIAKLRAKWRESGLCVSCGKNPTLNRKSLCGNCILSRRISTEGRAAAEADSPDVPRFGGACDICRNEISLTQAKLDHCHVTGRFRGWLCNRCNVGLGQFLDRIELLERAIKYLRLNDMTNNFTSDGAQYELLLDLKRPR